MLQRPKLGETEDDLIKLQQEFFRESGKELNSFNEVSEKRCEPQREFFGLVRDITEKNPIHSPRYYEVENEEKKGFPKPFLIDKLATRVGKRSKSLFAQAVENEKKKEAIGSDDDLVERQTMIDLRPYDHSNISELKNDVHNENAKLLSEMDHNEIIKKQKELLENMDPKFLALFKNKKKQSPKKIENADQHSIEVDCNAQKQVTETIRTYLDSKWVNMDSVEEEKLEWIGDIPDKKALEPNQSYSARFNFKGELQPYSTDIDVRTSLYHHGVEPERPGYTIQELYQLSRSQVLQQRILALNTLANIIRKTKLGYYDCCFDGQLLHKLIEYDLFFLLRFSIDDHALISASVSCLCNLICNECDEYCLDKLLGVTNYDVQPFLSNNIKLQDSEESEMKDHVIISHDLIRGMLRTDILARFSYILGKCAPNNETIVKVINCLIRISRHSVEATWKIIRTPGLLENVRESMRKKISLREGIKLHRIMVGQSAEVAKALMNPCDIPFLVRAFLEEDEDTTLNPKDFYRVKLETVYLWRNFMVSRFLVDEFRCWVPRLMRLLLFYTDKVDVAADSEFDFELFSALASLMTICNLHKTSLEPDVKAAMGTCLNKWLIQLSQKDSKFSYSVCKAVGSIFRYFDSYYRSFGLAHEDLDLIKMINSRLMNFFKSENYENILSALTTYSYLMCPSAAEDRDPDNLPSLSSVYLGGGDLVKIVHPLSPLPLFLSITKYLRMVCGVFCEAKPTSKLFLESQKNYIASFLRSRRINTHRWFMRFETELLVDTLGLMAIVGDDFCHWRLLPLSFRLMPALRMDDSNVREILSVIFNESHWFSSGKFSEGLLTTYLRCTFQEVPVPGCSSDLVPVEWPYKVFALLEDVKDRSSVIEALNFISFVLSVRPQMFDGISHASRYYYTCYVFLKDSLLFDEVVQNDLEKIIEDILANGQKVRLTLKMEKSKSFYDLYTEVINQYASISYGMPLFAKFILFPLQNEQDVSFRKLVWFEYLHVLRVVTLPFPEPDSLDARPFFEPCETDESLVVAYLNATSNGVVTKSRNPFVYTVAVGNIKNVLASLSRTGNQKLFNFVKNKVDNLKDVELKRDIENFCLDAPADYLKLC